MLTELSELQQMATQELGALCARHVAMMVEKMRLWASLDDFNATHNDLMSHLIAQIEQISDLRSHLREKQPLLLPLLCTLLLTLPTDLLDDDTPDDILYHFFCADHGAAASNLSSRADTLLRYLHPDRNPKPDDPDINQAAQLVLLITHIKRVLADIPLRTVYDHCGLPGLRRLLKQRHRCKACVPMENVGRFLQHGSVEYPQLLMLDYCP